MSGCHGPGPRTRGKTVANNAQERHPIAGDERKTLWVLPQKPVLLVLRNKKHEARALTTEVSGEDYMDVITNAHSGIRNAITDNWRCA